MTPPRYSLLQSLISRSALTAVAVLAPFSLQRGWGQHLNLAMTQTAQTQAALLQAAAAPARFAGFTDSAWLAASTPPPQEATPLVSEARLLTEAAAGASTSLPESPSAMLLAEASAPPAAAREGQFPTLDARTAPKDAQNRPIAPLYTKYIPAGWGYQPVHGREKLILGARDLYSVGNILAIVVSSGYSHLTNGQPNYGVNSEAFAKRLGAIAIRETAQGIFTDGVFAVIFHQDPRYFAEGRQYGFVHRAVYAATRPIIVRTTNGTGSTVNSSLLAGYAAAALLNNAYYPSINRNVKDTFSAYGTSLGGAALGFVVSEFTDDALQALHLKHKP